jgi:hypothetical protein
LGVKQWKIAGGVRRNNIHAHLEWMKELELELEPLECIFDKVTVYISDKRVSGGVYVLQRSARLT